MILKKNKYTLKQKQKIASKVYDITDEDLLEDYKKLVEIGCGKKHAKLSRVGNKVVNKFTATERLNTVYNLYRKNRICFYDVYYNKNVLKTQKRIKQMLSFYKKNRSSVPDTKVWFRIASFYFNNVSIFDPLLALDVYCKYKPTCVLDFTMGWGGRLVGACAAGVPKYIGIDNNKQLESPYKKLTAFLRKQQQENRQQEEKSEVVKTEIDLRFEDALAVDYSKLEYDMVLTSPPYYNIELYTATKEQSEEEWNTKFYVPLFTETFKHMKKGGHYCLNIPIDVYENVATKVLGKCDEKIPLAKMNRIKSKKEYIYVWLRKPTDKAKPTAYSL
jgi:hypothetical protein